jgi:hypothetical protein
VPNLTRRLEGRLKSSPELSNDLIEILTRATAQTLAWIGEHPLPKYPKVNPCVD